MKFSVFQVSRKGDREINQDRVGYCYNTKVLLLVVADGMGGHPMGETAAQIALQTVAAEFQIAATPLLKSPESFLRHAILAAHQNILSFGNTKKLKNSPRTTINLCVITNNCAYWAHVGDSRLYFYRDGSLMVRTTDHSHLEYMLSMHNGKLPPWSNPNRNTLYTCLGSQANPIITFAEPVTMQVGDKLLLCSDGLWSQIGEDLITSLLYELPLEQALSQMSDQAVADGQGYSDNVSVLAINWEGNEIAEGDI